MRTFWISLLTALMIVSAAATARAQLDDDPAVAKMKEALGALGKGARLRRNSGFNAARRRWQTQSDEIERAVADQNRALEEDTAEKLRQVKTLYASRANSRGRAVDHYLNGRLLGLTGELDLAYEEFKAALKQDLYLYWAWDGIGVYHVSRGDWALAREAFSRVLQLNPEHRKAAFGIVQAYANERNVPKAVSTLMEIINNEGKRLDPGVERQARMQLANLYRQQGEPANAIKELTWLIGHGADQLNVRALRAQCYGKLERWTDAIKDYRQMLVVDPKDHRLHFYVARCYAALGRNADAAREYSKGLDVGKGQVDIQTAEMIRDVVTKLRDKPAVQAPEKRTLNIDDYIARATNSPDLKKRRDAIFKLAGMPIDGSVPVDVIKKVLGVFLSGVRDNDHVIRAVSLREVVDNMAGTPRDEAVRGLVAEVARAESDPAVRATAYELLGTWKDRYVLPTLLMGLRKESDDYAFTQIHETMNRVSLAWVERIPPDDLSSQDMARIRSKWEAWYRKNRDVYRKYEPKDFK